MNWKWRDVEFQRFGALESRGNGGDFVEPEKKKGIEEAEPVLGR